MLSRKFPIEKGFQLVVFFLVQFWWEFLKKMMVDKGLIYQEGMTPQEIKFASKEDRKKNDLHFCNEFVFITICSDPAGPGSYFKEIIQKKLNILPIDQVYGLILEEAVLFQLTIDFCNHFNRNYQKEGKDPLRFAIDWLEDMQANPGKHQKEWGIWEETVEYVLSPGEKHLIF